MTSRQPEYHLKMMNKKTDQKSGKIGAGWVNPDGSLTLVVEYPHVVQDDPTGNIIYTLFPAAGPVKSSK